MKQISFFSFLSNTVILSFVLLLIGGWSGCDPYAKDDTSSLQTTSSNSIPIKWENHQPTINTRKYMDVALYTGNPLFIVKPGQEDKLTLLLYNGTPKPLEVTLKISIENASYLSPQYKTQEPFTIPSKKVAKWPIPRHLLGKLGSKYLHYQVKYNDKTLSGKQTFAYMSPVGASHEKESEFIFGLGGGDPVEGLSQKLRIKAMALLGVKSIRSGISWHEVQKTAQSWDWKAFDEIVNTAGEYGIDVQTLLGFTPGWAFPKKYGGPRATWALSVPPELEAWKTFLAEAGKRYKGRIKYWEVWNEPDLPFWRGTDEEYLKLLKAAYIELKKADPNCLVMNGGFGDSEHGHRNNPELFDKMLKDYSDFFDLIAYHRHSIFMTFRPELDNYILPRLKKYNIKQPLVFNETSIARPYETEHEVGEELVKRLSYAWSKGARGYYMFSLTDVGNSSNPLARRYGILNEDLSPRPAYVMYNTLIRYLRHKKFFSSFPLKNDQHAYLFGQEDQWTLVSWKQDKRGADQLLNVAVSPSAKAFLVDLMGNKTPIPNINGNVLFQTHSVPRYLVIEGSSQQPNFSAPFLTANSIISNIPGKLSSVPIQIHSPYPYQEEKPSLLTLQLLDPSGLTTSPLETQKIELKTNQPQSSTFSFTSSSSFHRDQNELPALQLGYQISGTPLSGQLRIPITMAFTTSSSLNVNQSPDFNLHQQSNVFNLNENLPQTDHLNWTGPKDLSTKIWLGRKNKNLLVNVVVEDDVHHPAEPGKIWSGDCLQIGLGLPEEEGFTELRIAHHKKGQNTVELYHSLVHAWKPGQAKEIKVTANSSPGKTVYQVEIPYSFLKLSDAILEKGILFNLVVRDNDGDGLAGWIRIAPGMTEDTRSNALFPVLVFQKQ